MAISGIGMSPEPQEFSNKGTTKTDSSNSSIFDNETTLNNINTTADEKLTQNEVIEYFTNKFVANFQKAKEMTETYKGYITKFVNDKMQDVIKIGDKSSNTKALKELESIDTYIHEHLNCKAINQDYNEDNRRIK